MHTVSFSRRAALATLASPWLGGCSTPLPLGPRPATDAAANARLMQCAEAHGWAAYQRTTDIAVSYNGQWQPLIDRIQPEVVDIGYRGPSQERLIPAAGISGQAYVGPRGRKHVLWRRDSGQVAVWFDGQRSTDQAAGAAAALVAECYGLFLLGPLWLAGRDLPVQAAGTERVDGRLCDVVNVWLQPGLGQVATDRAALCIDRQDHVMRRVRFTLEGFASTRGAVAETDTFDHQRRFGVLWPMRSFERVVHPISIAAHDWHITGLDVNRGCTAEDLAGPSFSGVAAAPAKPL